MKTFIFSIALLLNLATAPLIAEQNIKKEQKKEKGAIGIGLDISREAKSLPGASVLRIIPGLPAFQAGMQPGDIITKISGKNVSSEEEVPKLVSSIAVGETIDIEVKRNEELLNLKVTIISRTHIEERGLSSWVGKKAPPLFVTSKETIYPLSESKASDEAPVNLIAAIKKPTLIMVWATWCVACKQVMPLMDRLAEQYPGKFHPLLISNETADITTPFFKKLPKAKYSHLDFRETDQGMLHIAYWVDTLPTMIVLDASGKIKHVTHRFAPEEIIKNLGI